MFLEEYSTVTERVNDDIRLYPLPTYVLELAQKLGSELLTRFGSDLAFLGEF